MRTPRHCPPGRHSCCRGEVLAGGDGERDDGAVGSRDRGPGPQSEFAGGFASAAPALTALVVALSAVAGRATMGEFVKPPKPVAAASVSQSHTPSVLPRVSEIGRTASALGAVVVTDSKAFMLASALSAARARSSIPVRMSMSEVLTTGVRRRTTRVGTTVAYPMDYETPRL